MMVIRNEVVVKGPDMSSDPLASLPWSLKEANVFWTNAWNWSTAPNWSKEQQEKAGQNIALVNLFGYVRLGKVM